VVDYVRKLSELDLKAIEPTSHAHRVENVFRQDETRPGLDRDTVLKNAPAVTQDHFMTPKIVE
jgi:aspartyl-tRNA(Asn)/glutamyl-tRNA(Gln) amidotransferase subunit C